MRRKSWLLTSLKVMRTSYCRCKRRFGATAVHTAARYRQASVRYRSVGRDCRCRNPALLPSGGAVHSFLPAEAAGRAHRAVARHGSGDFVETLLQRIGGVSLSDLVGKIAEPWPHRLSKSETTGYHSVGAESISDDIQPLAPGETSRANRDSELPLSSVYFAAR
ncbi:hypothetical protein BQ8482_160066 [Mesorhizobium delmotii]|uniref:Uncharacterized protein n=1 Tax=Mesorhizobium delmotii TaxID=1631247 RepID=A0A2P9AHJ0_9HYPH|nr:hypothetical protein BQ8482_160066 [Mesorhizobium delmotii]